MWKNLREIMQRRAIPCNFMRPHQLLYPVPMVLLDTSHKLIVTSNNAGGVGIRRRSEFALEDVMFLEHLKEEGSDYYQVLLVVS
jgi:hypothetical protein